MPSSKPTPTPSASSCSARKADPRNHLHQGTSTMQLLPLATEPFTCPTDRDMLPSERREFVQSHRTCVFGTPRRADGPAMSIVYYVPTDTDELLVSTMRG